MKLTNRELALIAKIGHRRNERRIGIWVFLGTLVVYLGLRVFGVVSNVEVSLDWLIIAYAVNYPLIAYSGYFRTTEEGAVDLLQRYIHTDAEAITQMADETRKS